MPSKTLLALTAKLTADTTKFKKGLDKGKKELNGFSKSIGKIGGLMAGAFAVGKIMAFGREAEAAFKIQEEAEIKLETVMRQRIKASEDEIESIKELSRVQQELGIISDEVTLSGTQQLATFANQTKTLKTLMPAMNNLLAQQKGYAANAGDAVNIANLMGKALQGQVGALTRVGISFTEAQAQILKFGNEEERAAVLAEVITDNVGEMNYALAQSDLGVNQQVLNSWGDFKESIGGIITSIKTQLAPALNTLLTGATEEMEVMGDVIDSETLKWWEKLLYFIDTSGLYTEDLVVKMEDAKEVMEETTPVVEEVTKEYIQQITTLQDLQDEQRENNKLISDTNIQDERSIAILNEKNLKLAEQIKFLKGLNSESLKRTESPEKVDPIAFGGITTTDFDTMSDEAMQDFKRNVKEYQAGALIVEETTLDLSSNVQGAMTGVITAFAESLGMMIAGTGSMEDVMGNIGAMFGDFLVSIGEAIIAYGVAAEAFQLAISNPITAILAGAALVVAGTLVRSMAAEGLALGGIVPPGYPGDSYPAMLTSGETVIPAQRLPDLTGSNNTIVMETIIKGDDLYLVQKRNDQRRNRIR